MKNIAKGTLALQSLFCELTDEDILASEIRHLISKTITLHRISLNLSQAEYAQKIGVSQGMISRWESGDYNFTIDMLAKIAVKTGLNLSNPLRDIHIKPNNNTYSFLVTKEKSNRFNSNHSKWSDFRGIAS